MAMPDIPDEILANILKLVANDRWWLLGPILKAGKRALKLVYSAHVLKDANIYTVCSDPSNIATYTHPVSGIQWKGRYRHFFERCLAAENHIAFYYEGLRVVAEERDINRGMSLLSRTVPKDAHATLACGLLSICVGNEAMAIYYLNLFGEKHCCLGTEEVMAFGEELEREMWLYRRTNTNAFASSFKFPVCDSIPSAECAMACLEAYSPNDILCNGCYLWWLARTVCGMI